MACWNLHRSSAEHAKKIHLDMVFKCTNMMHINIRICLLFKLKVEADDAAGIMLWTSRFLHEQGNNVKTMLFKIKGIRHLCNPIVSEVPESA